MFKEEKTIPYFNGDELAASTYLSKYALFDKEGNILEASPDEMHKRLARAFFEADQKYQDNPSNADWNNMSWYGRNRDKFTEDMIYNLLRKFELVIPGGSVMETGGTEKIQSLSNCFFNGAPSDNVESIMDIATSMAQIGKRRGGTATDISYLRPRGADINNAAKESTGAVSWMELYDVIGRLIGQNNRKMAMMISMDVNHPDIEEFIIIKRDRSKVTNANISIKLNDEFIKSVQNDEDYILTYPVNFDKRELDLIAWEQFSYNILEKVENSHTGEVIYLKKIKAKELWNKIIFSAWDAAEPGLFNWDRVINYDPTSVYPELKPQGTNPLIHLVA